MLDHTSILIIARYERMYSDHVTVEKEKNYHGYGLGMKECTVLM